MVWEEDSHCCRRQREKWVGGWTNVAMVKDAPTAIRPERPPLHSPHPVTLSTSPFHPASPSLCLSHPLSPPVPSRQPAVHPSTTFKAP